MWTTLKHYHTNIYVLIELNITGM